MRFQTIVSTVCDEKVTHNCHLLPSFSFLSFTFCFLPRGGGSALSTWGVSPTPLSSTLVPPKANGAQPSEKRALAVLLSPLHRPFVSFFCTENSIGGDPVSLSQMHRFCLRKILGKAVCLLSGHSSSLFPQEIHLVH